MRYLPQHLLKTIQSTTEVAMFAYQAMPITWFGHVALRHHLSIEYAKLLKAVYVERAFGSSVQHVQTCSFIITLILQYSTFCMLRLGQAFVPWSQDIDTCNPVRHDRTNFLLKKHISEDCVPSCRHLPETPRDFEQDDPQRWAEQIVREDRQP